MLLHFTHHYRKLTNITNVIPCSICICLILLDSLLRYQASILCECYATHRVLKLWLSNMGRCRHMIACFHFYCRTLWRHRSYLSLISWYCFQYISDRVDVWSTHFKWKTRDNSLFQKKSLVDYSSIYFRYARFIISSFELAPRCTTDKMRQ